MKKILKRVGIGVIFLLCLILIWRCCLVADKSKFSDLVLTDGLRSAYSGDNADVLTVQVAAEMSDSGRFAAYGFYYIPAAREVQLALRWNDSTYKAMAADPGTDLIFRMENETTGDQFDVTFSDSAHSTFYNYRRAVVHGITISEGDQIKLSLLHGDGSEADSMVIKHAEQEIKEYKIPSGLVKELQ
ncbi:MAG: hypothetical protein IJU57_02035 [Clostridia bacterium]|nr:hypothetical protein [Clostridia bacterium]